MNRAKNIHSRDTEKERDFPKWPCSLEVENPKMYQQVYPSLKIGTVCIVESVAGEVMGNSGSHLYLSKV